MLGAASRLLAPTLLAGRSVRLPARWGLRTFATFDDAIPIPMPALSPTMTHGNVARWALKVGDKIEPGEPMCEIETDKATVDYEAVEEGYLAKIVMQEGASNIPVGTTLGFFVEDESLVAEISKLEYSAPEASSEAVTEEPIAATSSSAQSSSAKQVRVSPAARHILDSYKVDASSLNGTGKHGMITKGDALQAVKGLPTPTFDLEFQPPAASAPSEAPAPKAQVSAVAPTPVAPSNYLKSSDRYVDTPASQMRKVIASRLLQSKKESPHFYASTDCNIDQVLAMRSTLREQVGTAPSVNDVIIKAVSLALRDVPEMNCQLVNGKVVQMETVDISVAVATPSGLITPIVKNADSKGLLNISADMRDLAGRARENKLKLEEYQGGCFTVSNLGMFGIDSFQAVINSPQAGIMAVGSGRPVARVPADGVVDETNIEFDTMMTVSLSCDRNVVDEQIVGKYLQVFKQYMENPMFLAI